MSEQEPRSSSRRERAAAELQRQRRRERRRVYWLIGTGVLVLVGFASVLVAVQRMEADDPATASGGSADLSAVKTYEVSANHKTGPLEYQQSPPVGGDHNPVWLNCGVYDTEVPNENAAHSMEHGAVWLTYRPNLPDADVEQLQEALPSTYAILSPYEDQQAPVVASAWGTQLELKGADDPRLGAFLDKYVQGEQTPEPGAACTGGSDGTMPLDLGGGMSGS